MINYGFYKELNSSFGETLKRVIGKINGSGFGIVFQLDLKQKFKNKLGIEFTNYTILGLSDPSSALRSIQSEQNIGLMLPCNMAVFEKGNKTVVSIIKPTIAMSMIKNEELKSISCEVEIRLNQIFEAIE